MIESFTAYRATDVSATATKRTINQLLKKYGVTQVAWRWDPPRTAVVVFPIQNVIVQIPVSEKLAFDQGMRALYWHLKTWLEELALDLPAEQIFMPYIVIRSDAGVLTTIAQDALPQLRRRMLRVDEFPALTERR